MSIRKQNRFDSLAVVCAQAAESAPGEWVDRAIPDEAASSRSALPTTMTDLPDEFASSGASLRGAENEIPSPDAPPITMLCEASP